MGRREEVVVMGSGFIISPDGYVVTAESASNPIPSTPNTPVMGWSIIATVSSSVASAMRQNDFASRCRLNNPQAISVRAKLNADGFT